MHATNWGAQHEFRLPFIFSTNGRPFLRQLETHSGIWFCDVRRPDNLGHALQWLVFTGRPDSAAEAG
jgi:type I restriction enzyme R subunit